MEAWWLGSARADAEELEYLAWCKRVMKIFGRSRPAPSALVKGASKKNESAAITRPLLLLTLLIALACGVLFAQGPGWWMERDVIVPGADADDFAAVNQGQLKNITWRAYLELEAKLAGGAGPAIEDLIDSWVTLPTGIPAPGPNADDFAAANLGQAKALAKPFYDRLIAAGQIEYNAQQDTSRYLWLPLEDQEGPGRYPWDRATAAADDHALINIGQVKNLFSFDVISTAAPQNLVAAATSMTTISVTWDPVHGATSYVLERMSESDPEFELLADNLATPTYADTTATPDTLYFYRVKSEGGTAYSNIDDAIIEDRDEDALVDEVDGEIGAHGRPILKIVSGNSQGGEDGELLSAPVVVEVSKLGLPLEGANVTITRVVGDGTVSNSSGGTFASTANANTASNGQTAFYLKPGGAPGIANVYLVGFDGLVAACITYIDTHSVESGNGGGFPTPVAPKDPPRVIEYPVFGDEPEIIGPLADYVRTGGIITQALGRVRKG
jgi:hypothetical protein